jgi:hypothetical protein
MGEPGKAPPKVSQPQRLKILNRWAKDQPRAGAAETHWYEQLAEQTGHTIPQVRRVVAEEAAAEYAQIKGEMRTDASRIATYIGASEVRAMQVLVEGLEAEEISVVRDGHGNPLLGTDGQPLTTARRIWPVQMKAAELILQLHDAFSRKTPPPPVKVEMQMKGAIEVSGHTTQTQTVVVVDAKTLSEAEVYERYIAMRREVEERLRNIAPAAALAIAGTTSPGDHPASPGAPSRGTDPQGAGRGGEAQYGADDPALSAGYVVLDHGMHEDQGRAGSEEPLQELPEG